MAGITIAYGSPEGIQEDLREICGERSEAPAFRLAGDREARRAVRESASALFPRESSVLVLVDPGHETLDGLTDQLLLVKDRLDIIIYYTAEPAHAPALRGKTVRMEKDRAKRLEQRVLRTVKAHGKVMTDKAYALFKDMIGEESMVDGELMKLINYTGDRKKIDSRDVRAVVADSREETLLNLTEALSAGNREKVLAIFEDLVEQGTPLLWVHSFLVRQTRLLLQAKDMEELVPTRHDYPLFQKVFTKWKQEMEIKPSDRRQYLPLQKPYYAFKLFQASRKTSKADLLSLMDALASFDRELKSGTKFELLHLEQVLLGR